LVTFSPKILRAAPRALTVALSLTAVLGASVISEATAHAAAPSTLPAATKAVLRQAAAPKVWIAKPHFALYPPNTAYPWIRDQTQGLDTYGMTKRQCVSFAAWYINMHGTPFGYMTKGPKGVGTFNNATVWDAAAFKAGFVVSTRPLVGSIAQWHAYETSTWLTPTYKGWMKAGWAGHVAIVTRVYWNGNVDIAQYNGPNPRGYSVAINVRAPRYIYVPLLAPRVAK
jgi:surface antigen